MTISNKTFAAAVLAATLLSGGAFAADAFTLDAPYVAGQIGLNMPTGDSGTLDNDAAFAGALGYRIHPNIRVEGEVSYRKNDYSDTIGGITASGDTKVATALINGWYDFTNSSKFTPYVGGGVGFSRGWATLNALGVTVKEKDSAFTYQLGGGVAYALNDRLDLTTDYRYLDTANFSDIGDDYRAHEIRVGMRYSF
jgi:opacity protein-like surface antigen